MSDPSPLSRKTEALFRLMRSRHGRRDSEFCFCDGVRSASEVAHLVPQLIDQVFVRQGTEIPFPVPVTPTVLSPVDFERIAPTVTSQGIILVIRRPDLVPLAEPLVDPFVLVLDRIGDPGNLGTILRTARAVGIRDVWMTKGTADPYSDKVLRSASGAQFALRLRQSENLQTLADDLRKLGISAFYRTLPAAGGNVFLEQNLFDHSAIILGCEATGVAELEPSFPLNIPMPGDAESLNVAQAATVILFEFVRRQFL